MNQEWFEMRNIRRRRLDDAVWIPIAANQEKHLGKHGYAGYESEYFEVFSIAVPIAKKNQAEKLRWTDISLHRHIGSVQDGCYVPADVFEEDGLKQTISIVLQQEGNGLEPPVWHLHQDLVITLGLKREDNIWLAMNEGYVDVARLHASDDGRPYLLEVRAEHLKDYLCARNMALYVSSYRCHEETVDDSSHIKWPDNPFLDHKSGIRWEGRMTEIHEGGAFPFGASAAIVHVGRTNIDLDEDVPRIGPSDEGIVHKSWVKTFAGRKLYFIQGELWRNEWINPAKHSPRVRKDKVLPSVFFVTDASGTRESGESLRAGGRWLWFRPDVITELAHRRGGKLRWYTRDTGEVMCSPDYGVHFGVNNLGLVNAYAKDIAFLPQWQQRLWAGFNVSPEAGVSEELLEAQGCGIPAETQAPERLLPTAIELLNEVGVQQLGSGIFREHEQLGTILSRTHRFRSVDTVGFLSLAKDLARLTIDRIDGSALQKILTPSKGQKWGSLKMLENVIALRTSQIGARQLLGPLHGVYHLRNADAHLPTSDLEEAFALVHVNQTSPFVCRGYQLIHSCVSSLFAIAESLKLGKY